MIQNTSIESLPPETSVMTGGSSRNRYLLYQLLMGMRKAEQIDIIVSFLMESGVKLLISELENALNRGVRIRILIGYYNSHAQAYFDETVSANMHETCDRFLKYVRPGGTIMDVGAGSGRDLRYFAEKGYRAEGIDASKELCTLASEYAHVPVTCIRIQDWIPEERYAGIWASASLPHLTRPGIEAFIRRMPDMLEENGAAYISLKSGIRTGEDEKGRYFTNVTEDELCAMIGGVPGLEIAELWNSGDVMQRQGFYWVNVILKIV